jgi:hypothetical protein
VQSGDLYNRDLRIPNRAAVFGGLFAVEGGYAQLIASAYRQADLIRRHVVPHLRVLRRPASTAKTWSTMA